MLQKRNLLFDVLASNIPDNCLFFVLNRHSFSSHYAGSTYGPPWLTVRYLPWKYLNFKGSKKKYTVAGFLQGHPNWTPKKGSKGHWAKFWTAWIWRNFLCQKMLFLAIFTHFLCAKFNKNSLVIQKWQYLPPLEILEKLVQQKLQK